MSSLSGAPKLGGSRSATGGSGLGGGGFPQSGIRKTRSTVHTDSLSHLDDLFDDPPASKKGSDKKGSKKGSTKKPVESKSKMQKNHLDSSTDEEMFPKAKGAFGRGGGLSIFERSQTMPVAPPSDSEDSPTGAAGTSSNLRARRGLGKLSSSGEGPSPLQTSSALPAIGGAPPSPLDAGERLMSFLQEEAGEVQGTADLNESSDLDVFGTGNAKKSGAAISPRITGRRSTMPVTSTAHDPLAGIDDNLNDDPITREVPIRVSGNDFLDLDAPDSPPAPQAISSRKDPSQTAGPRGANKKEDSDEWALDLDILPEGGGFGRDALPQGATEATLDPTPAISAAAYTPSGSTARAGRRATGASSVGSGHQQASAAARSRLAEEAKRQMERDLESSGEIEVPGLHSGQPPPISSSAAAKGRRSSYHGSPPLTPQGGVSPLGNSPKDAVAPSGRRNSGADVSAAYEQFAREKDALKAEHRLAMEGLQDEVRRLATKLAEASTNGADSKKVSDLEAQLRDMHEKQEADREKHVNELQSLRVASADNDSNLSKIAALQREKEAMQRNLDHKDSQLRELDAIQAQLREKDYKLHEANKALDLAKAEHSAALSSTSASLQAEVASLKRQAEDIRRESEAEKHAVKAEADRDAARKVDEAKREMEMLKAELDAAEKRIVLEAANAEVKGRREAEEERDQAVRELRARETALKEEREVVQRHAVSAQVLSDLSNKVDDVAAKAIEREDRVARSIDRNLQERESVLSAREADIALREESLGAREREAEMLRRQLQTILAALEKTSIEEKQELMVEKQRLQREQSRLDALTGALQGERADLKIQVETEQEALTAAREARISDREALVRELCEERRRVAEERISSANAADLARTEEHSARRRCFEYEARANAALAMAKEQEERADASAAALEAERKAISDARDALEKEKAAIHEEAAQLTALGLQIQGRSAELRSMQEEVEKKQRLVEEKNASLVAERAGIQAKEQGIGLEKKRLAEQRRAGEGERLRIAAERKALASDRVAASKATEAARDVQAQLSMVVRAWAAEGISIPVDWEALNFSPSALSEGALHSIRMKVANEAHFGTRKLKANHTSKAAKASSKPGAVSETVRKQQEFLEQLKRQDANFQALLKSSQHPNVHYQQQQQPHVSMPPVMAHKNSLSSDGFFIQQNSRPAAAGVGPQPLVEQEMPSPSLTSMAQLSSSSASSGGGGRAKIRVKNQLQAAATSIPTQAGGLLTAISPLDPSSASSGNGNTSGNEDALRGPHAIQGAEPEGRDSSIGLQDIDEAEEW